MCAFPALDAAAAPPTYTVTDLGSFGADTNLVGMKLNDAGQVVGHVTIGSAIYPFLSDGATKTEIVGPNGFNPTDISDAGVVIGTSSFASSTTAPLGFVYDLNANALSYYGTAIPKKINSHGQILGVYAADPTAPKYYGLFFSPDGRTAIDLAPLVLKHFASSISESNHGIPESSLGPVDVVALNDSGLAVARLGSGISAINFAFNVNDIVTLGLENTFAYDYPIYDRSSLITVGAINDNGQAAGYRCKSVYYGPCASFVSDSSGLHDINGVISVEAMNNAGLIVGTNNSTSTAVISDGSVVYNLRDLIAPGDPAKDLFNFFRAIDINNSGEILVMGFYNYGPTHSFLFKPVVATP